MAFSRKTGIEDKASGSSEMGPPERIPTNVFYERTEKAFSKGQINVAAKSLATAHARDPEGKKGGEEINGMQAKIALLQKMHSKLTKGQDPTSDYQQFIAADVTYPLSHLYQIIWYIYKNELAKAIESCDNAADELEVDQKAIAKQFVELKFLLGKNTIDSQELAKVLRSIAKTNDIDPILINLKFISPPKDSKPTSESTSSLSLRA